jgi:DNA (cytosine-5)-methyltransferase 1
MKCKCIASDKTGFESNNRVYDTKALSPTVRTFCGGNQEIKIPSNKKNVMRIRRLTPRECWRLMDFDDADYDAAASVNSESQLYKQAGNSIVVNVLVAIFGQMVEGKENVYKEEQ